MDNKRILSDYDMEIHVGEILIQNVIGDFFRDYFSIIVDNIDNKMIHDILVSLDVNKLPVPEIDIPFKKFDDGFDPHIKVPKIFGMPIDLYMMFNFISMSKMNINMKFFLNDLEVYSTDIPVDLPADLASYIDSVPAIVKCMGTEGYDDSIALLINLPLDLGDDSDVPRGDACNVCSILPAGEHYALAFGKNSFGRFEKEIKNVYLPKLKKKYASDLERVSFKSVDLSAKDRTLKLVIKGVYDVKGLIDSLDPDIKLTLSFKFDVANGRLSINSDADLHIEKNILYSIICALIGLWLPPFGVFVGLHANSIIDYVANKIGDEKIDPMLDGESNDYYYLGSNVKSGCFKVGRDNSLKTYLNYLPNSEFPVYKFKSDDFFSTTNMALGLTYSDIQMDKDGFSVCGKMTHSVVQYCCDDLDIVKSVYKDRKLVGLIYRNKDGVEKELGIDEIYTRVKDSRLSRFRVTRHDDFFIQTLKGNLPYVVLPFPSRIRRYDGRIAAFEYESGLVLMVDDIFDLYERDVIHFFGLNIIKPRNGRKYFRTSKDYTDANNLEVLPIISDEKWNEIMNS